MTQPGRAACGILRTFEDRSGPNFQTFRYRRNPINNCGSAIRTLSWEHGIKLIAMAISLETPRKEEVTDLNRLVLRLLYYPWDRWPTLTPDPLPPPLTEYHLFAKSTIRIKIALTNSWWLSHDPQLFDSFWQVLVCTQ